MKRATAVLALVCLLAGCAEYGPLLFSSQMGSLELRITAAGDGDVQRADIYVDGRYVGNYDKPSMVLHVRRGARDIRVTLEGYEPYRQMVAVLAQPNEQVLTIHLEKAKPREPEPAMEAGEESEE
jgi:hypothetical protein